METPNSSNQLYVLVGQTNAAIGRVEGMLAQHLENYKATTLRQEAAINQHTIDIHEMRAFQDRMRGAGRLSAILAAALGAILGWMAKYTYITMK